MEQNKGQQISKVIRKSQQERKRQSGAAMTLLVGSLVVLLLLLALVSVMQTIQSVDAHSLYPPDGSEHHQPAANTNGNGNGNAKSGRQQTQAATAGTNQGSAGNQNRCQSGWMWFNNKCWVTTQSRRDFIHAVELCKRSYNSTLPTIHSEEENEFLRQNIELTNSPIWLYARHNHQYNKTRWLDKSMLNYTHWDAGQPSDKSSLVCIKTEDSWYMKKAEPVDGQTECVSFWEDAKWGTQVGCQVLLPVVCEKKLTPISRFSQDGSAGANGTISSQFEQQQMYNPISGSSSLLLSSNLLYALTLVASSLGVVSFI